MYRPIPQGHRIRSETVKRVTAGNTAVLFFRKQSEAKKKFLSQKLTIFNIIFDVFFIHHIWCIQIFFVSLYYRNEIVKCVAA